MASPKAMNLEAFRSFPEKVLRANGAEWRYRSLGTSAETLLLVPGGELVNDIAFDFALALKDEFRIVYPAYPRINSIEELSDGLGAILDAEGINQAAVLGASFGGALAQVFVRRHPQKVGALILSNTGVPLAKLVGAVRITGWLTSALPWSATARLLRKPLMKILASSEADAPFWNSYLDELFSKRLTKADVVANARVQLQYHRRYHFSPEDLKDWPGRILIAESDTDVIGPKRREALRRTYPQAEVHTFHNAGHGPMFTRFDEYLAMVRGFLSKAAASQTTAQ